MCKLPEKIESLLLRRVDIDDELGAKRLAMKTIEATVSLDVCGAKDDKGKLILTNDKQREAAISEMLGGNEDFKKLYGQVRDLERERLVLDANLERARLEAKYELEEARNKNLVAELRVADAVAEARRQPVATWEREPPAVEVEMPF